MKRYFSILIILVLFPAYCFAEEQKGNDCQQSTEKEITFLSIPWGSSLKGVSNAMDSSTISIIEKKTKKRPGYDYDSLMNMTESYNFHDPRGDVFQYLASKYIETTLLEYKCSITVGGYDVDKITMYFMNENDYGLYKGEYHFYTTSNNPRNYTYVDEYQDLKQKLSNLYGIPYDYEGAGADLVGGIQERKWSVWKGANTTGVLLEYESHTGGIMDGITSLRLTYGTGEVDRIFIEKNAIKELEEEQERQKQLEEIHNDNSGL